MPQIDLRSGRSVKIARTFLSLYSGLESPSESPEPNGFRNPLPKCREALIREAESMKAVLDSSHACPQVLAAYDHRPMQIETEPLTGFMRSLLETVKEYDELIQIVDTAWISQAISGKDRTQVITKWEGRLYQTAKRASKHCSEAGRTFPEQIQA